MDQGVSSDSRGANLAKALALGSQASFPEGSAQPRSESLRREHAKNYKPQEVHIAVDPFVCARPRCIIFGDPAHSLRGRESTKPMIIASATSENRRNHPLIAIAERMIAAPTKRLKAMVVWA